MSRRYACPASLALIYFIPFLAAFLIIPVFSVGDASVRFARVLRLILVHALKVFGKLIADFYKFKNAHVGGFRFRLGGAVQDNRKLTAAPFRQKCQMIDPRYLLHDYVVLFSVRGFAFLPLEFGIVSGGKLYFPVLVGGQNLVVVHHHRGADTDFPRLLNIIDARVLARVSHGKVAEVHAVHGKRRMFVREGKQLEHVHRLCDYACRTIYLIHRLILNPFGRVLQ